MPIKVKNKPASNSPHGQAAMKMGEPVPTPPVDNTEPDQVDGDGYADEQEPDEIQGQDEGVADLSNLGQDVDAGESTQAVATITKTHEKDGEVLSSEVHQENAGAVHVSAPASQTARVRVGQSFKFPIMDYTMIGFEVSIEIPCPVDGVDETFDAGREWVEERLNTLISEQQAVQQEGDAAA